MFVAAIDLAMIWLGGSEPVESRVERAKNSAEIFSQWPKLAEIGHRQFGVRNNPLLQLILCYTCFHVLKLLAGIDGGMVRAGQEFGRLKCLPGGD